MTGVRSAGHLAVAPYPGPRRHGAAGGVAGAARAAPDGGADDVGHRPARRLPQDEGRAGATSGRAVLGHQRLRQNAGTAQIAKFLVQTHSQLGQLGPRGQLPAPLRR